MGIPRRISNCGTVTPNGEAVLDAVRQANGRCPVRPAVTIEEATAEVEAYLVVPEWSAGELAEDVAAEVLRSLHGVEPSGSPFLWALYTEGARRLGFSGDVPVPSLDAARATT